MRAMILHQLKSPLQLEDIPIPKPGPNQLLIKIAACGVCRTDLHLVDGELPSPKLPLVPGHQIVGTIAELGAAVRGFTKGEKVGVPWLAWTCGVCPFCKSGRENLCDKAQFTGYHLNGGFAEYCTAHADYCFKIPPQYSYLQAAPLLCAGLIGFRAYQFAGEAKRIGFYGFGASAHILAQIAIKKSKEVFAFTRPGDRAAQKLALKLGAKWAGSSEENPPQPLDAAILFAPVGSLVPQALRAVNKGGKVICAGIHMSDIPSFPYELLWEERSICSVANLTRLDGQEFFKLASEIPLNVEITPYPLEQANLALNDLRHSHFTGAAVLQIAPS